MEDAKKKKLESMTSKEILHQQLELVAERSQSCLDEELYALTETMIKICKTLVSI